MNKKYLFALMAVATVSTFSFVGCGSSSNNATVADATVTEAASSDAAVTDGAATETAGAYTDGTYTSTAATDDNGYTAFVEMTVECGNITSITWDATDADGNSKKDLATDGTYDMQNDGLNWAEQSNAICQYIVENQSFDGITLDSDDKTDAVSGVTISVDSFETLLSDCMDQASAN